jgi:hypothetical protein
MIASYHMALICAMNYILKLRFVPGSKRTISTIKLKPTKCIAFFETVEMARYTSNVFWNIRISIKRFTYTTSSSIDTLHI